MLKEKVWMDEWMYTRRIFKIFRRESKWHVSNVYNDG